MLPNEPHAIEGHLNLSTHVAQTALCHISGWLEQLADTRHNTVGLCCFPFTSKKTNTNTGHWHVKETLTQKIQWRRMFSSQKDVKFHSVSGGSL